MTDHAVALQTIPVSEGRVAVGRAAIAVPTVGGEVTAWGVHVATMDGTIVADLDEAEVVSITWGVDVPTVAVFNVPIDDPNVGLLPCTGGVGPPDDYEIFDPVHEVKIYRNGVIIFWGPAVTRRANSQTRQWQYTAYDPLWYLLHRYIGQANRHNYLGNADDSVNPNLAAQWTAVGGASLGDDTTRYVLQPSSIEVNGTSSGENYIYRRFTQTSTSIGLALIVTAWVYVDDMTAPAILSRGVYFSRVGASGPGASATIPLDQSTPRAQWTRLSAAILMPPSVTETIEVRLYCPDGTTHWDAITVTIEESVGLIDENSPDGTGWDQVQIAQQVVRYASGSWPVGPSYRKSNLQLAVAGAASGIKKERVYQFFDHQAIYQGGTGSGALDEWVKAADGFDYRIDLTPETRTFRTYYPSVGVEWDPDTITFTYTNLHDDAGKQIGESIGIVGWDMGETIEGSATDVCELGGWGSGAGREEGGFTIDGLGDLTLELVESAPTDAPIDLLNQVATGRAEQLANPIRTPVLTIVEPKDPVTQDVTVPLIGVLMPGDIIWVLLLDGSVVINNNPADDPAPVPFRVAQLALSGDDVLTAALG